MSDGSDIGYHMRRVGACALARGGLIRPENAKPGRWYVDNDGWLVEMTPRPGYWRNLCDLYPAFTIDDLRESRWLRAYHGPKPQGATP